MAAKLRKKKEFVNFIAKYLYGTQKASKPSAVTVFVGCRNALHIIKFPDGHYAKSYASFHSARNIFANGANTHTPPTDPCFQDYFLEENRKEVTNLLKLGLGQDGDLACNVYEDFMNGLREEGK